MRQLLAEEQVSSKRSIGSQGEFKIFTCSCQIMYLSLGRVVKTDPTLLIHEYNTGSLVIVTVPPFERFSVEYLDARLYRRPTVNRVPAIVSAGS